MMLSAVIVWAALACAAEPVSPAETAAFPQAVLSHLTLDDLLRMDRCQLECLYRQAPVACVHCGFHRGQAIRCPGSCWTVPLSRLYGLAWKGKNFSGCGIVNRWLLGLKAIRGQTGIGPSWLDGRPSLVLDYQGHSLVWDEVRDELRQVGPGLYLGIMYRRRCPSPRQVMFFALEGPCCRP